MATVDLSDAQTVVAAGAAEIAARAARTSGVTVRELKAAGELNEACGLLRAIWRPEPTKPPVVPEMLRAFVKSGNCVTGAFRGDELVGVCVGFFGDPSERTLYSHIAGVIGRAANQGVGRALKLHQRAWSLARGCGAISWTFDPLVRRNAHFNIARLRATPHEYLTQFYGNMNDAINGSDDTDRLLVRWQLTAPAVTAAASERSAPVSLTPAAGSVILAARPDGGPRVTPPSAPTVLVGVPDDVETLRQSDPVLASEWRVALREALGGMMAAGSQVTGFTRSGGYVVQISEGTRT